MIPARRRLAAAALAGATLLAACGSVRVPVVSGKRGVHTPRPTSRPGVHATPAIYPPTFFADRDTPYDHADDALQAYWEPYGVETVPGSNALDGEPPAPRVVNMTNDVPDDVAQQWGHALMHTAAWERWAIRAAQAGLLGRLGRDASQFQQLVGASTLVRPDCDLFPVQLALLENEASSGPQADQYSFMATYQGTGGAACTVTRADPGSPSRTVRSYVSDTEVMSGWLHRDPVLGDVWLADTRTTCTVRCPVPPAGGGVPVAVSPPLPDADTPVTDATPAQVAAWRAYSVTVIPGVRSVSGVPELPALDNQTLGSVTSDQASTWETALFRDLAWQQWVWRTAQIPFLAHLAGREFPNADLRSDAAQGAHTGLPACAAFPTTVRLAQNQLSDRNLPSSAQTTQYHFDLTFATGCHVVATLPSGASKDVGIVHNESVYGDLRTDPLLGTVWFPLDAVSHDSDKGARQ